MISRALLVIEPIVYGILLLPVAYLLKLHGKPGFLWTLYLTLFSLLHVIGGIMMLCESKHALIILNICVGILILATSAIWFELNHHWETNNAMQKIKVAIIHILVIVGELLLILGATDPGAQGSAQVKIGIGLGCLAVAAKLMVIQAIVAIVEKDCSWKDDKSRLLFATTFGSVCLCVRVIYSMCVMTKTFAQQERCASSMQGIYFVLLPEALTAIAYLAVGLWTRNIGESQTEDAKEDTPDLDEQAPPPMPMPPMPPMPNVDEPAWGVPHPVPIAPRPRPAVAELAAQAAEARRDRQPEAYEMNQFDPLDEWQNVELAS
ncbi:uncharacterized protein FIESC28_09310 [Fusarium coffeatum]|uniref:DUF7702 domain-containing protein n=1 Tax=Fusarium coffeatum TaxID=231269 RepID=A0A366R0V8_9HYPO|nr:uncharacterized protein FIESC28_09310 [Fusarium coffeatum]RBR10779.1 hypothetical protein FIESC28_09310 [Fusarium coffeatum]